LRLHPPNHKGNHRLAMAINIMELLLSGSLPDDYQENIAVSALEFYHTLQAIVA